MTEQQLLEFATNVRDFQHKHSDVDKRPEVAQYIISLLQQGYTCKKTVAELKEMRKVAFENREYHYLGFFEAFTQAINLTKQSRDWVRFHTKKDKQVA